MASGKKKETYPQKRTMNLYFKPDRTTVPATVALYVLFALTLLLAFCKFFIYDRQEEIREQSEALASLQYEQSLYEEQLSDYDEVLSRYRLYSVTEDEERQTDRMEILELVDTVIRSKAKITGFSVSDGYVNVSFTGVTLKQTAEIVRTLDESPLVLRTTVNTASTGGSTAGSVDSAAGTADIGTADAGAADAGAVDAGTVDVGAADAGSADADMADAGTVDVGAADAGAADAGTADASAADAGTADASAADAGTGDAAAPAVVDDGYDASAAAGNWVTAKILIVLQKENTGNETTTDRP